MRSTAPEANAVSREIRKARNLLLALLVVAGLIWLVSPAPCFANSPLPLLTPLEAQPPPVGQPQRPDSFDRVFDVVSNVPPVQTSDTRIQDPTLIGTGFAALGFLIGCILCGFRRTAARAVHENLKKARLEIQLEKNQAQISQLEKVLEDYKRIAVDQRMVELEKECARLRSACAQLHLDYRNQLEARDRKIAELQNAYAMLVRKSARRTFSEKESKLARLALDPSAKDGEFRNAAVFFFRSLRTRFFAADQLL